MPTDSTIALRRVIVHKVDHKMYDEPLLSDLESPVTGEVASFLRQHIYSNRQHRHARAARFLESRGTPPSTCSMCYDILDDPGRFVELSRGVATRLFESMREDKRISPGDLIVCTFVEIDDAASEWLGLLKMDPQDGFVGEREEVGGQLRVVLRRVPGVFPTGELQKCCFILPETLRQGRRHDLIVLDQQAARYYVQRIVASFFLSDFLNCEVGFDSADVTQAFILHSHDWVAQKEGVWSADDLARFRRRVVGSAADHLVDAAQLAEEIVSDAGERDEYLDHLRAKGLRELTFEPDPTEGERWARYCYFKGDDDLEIRIRKDAVGAGNTLEWTRDSATNKHIVTIRTANWVPTLRRGR